MISTDKIKQKEKELEFQIKNYKNFKWHQGYKGVAVKILILYFIYTSWSYLFFALFILPLIYFVKKGSLKAIVISKIYLVLLTILFIMNYLAENMSDNGFNSSLFPVVIFMAVYYFTFTKLSLVQKVEKIRSKLSKS